MQLTKEQEAAVRAWAAEGASLSDIQSRLADEFGIRISYLDTRFLLIDLKVDLAEKPEKKSAPAADLSRPAADDYGAAPPLPDRNPDPYDPTSGSVEDYDVPSGSDDDFDSPDASGAPGSPDAPSGAQGAVSVELDRIQRPGFAASGSIVCSDGVKGEWGIDAYGRLALAFPDRKGYRPSAADQQAFMDKLRELLSGGY